jgi:protocatechuate 3,4-dioxygenase beta subunit
MKHLIENRREFLKRASLSVLSIPFLFNCKINTSAQKSDAGILSAIRKNAVISPECNWCGAVSVPDDVIWKTSLAAEKAEGEPLIISGTVFLADGVTPAPNILIYAYHTDSKGFYGKGNGEHPHGKHHGWMLTNNKGQYEFRTIKPAPYPNRDTPAHIHFTLTGENFKEYWIDDIWFEGDSLITPKIKRRQLSGRGGFNPIIRTEKTADRILRGTRNIRL